MTNIDVRAHRPSLQSQVQTVLSGRTQTQHGTLEMVAVFCHGYTSGTQLWPGHARDFAQAIHVPEPTPPRSAATDLRVVLYSCCSAATPSTRPLAEYAQPHPERHRAVDCSGDDRGHQSFAERLCAALKSAGLGQVQVDAHFSLGHSTRNPEIRRFLAAPPPSDGTGDIIDGIYRCQIIPNPYNPDVNRSGGDAARLHSAGGRSHGGEGVAPPGSVGTRPAEAPNAAHVRWSAWCAMFGNPLSTMRIRFPFMSIAEIRREVDGRRDDILREHAASRA